MDHRIEIIGKLVKQVASLETRVRLMAEGMKMVQDQVSIITNHLKNSVPDVVASKEPNDNAANLDCVDLSSK